MHVKLIKQTKSNTYIHIDGVIDVNWESYSPSNWCFETEVKICWDILFSSRINVLIIQRNIYVWSCVFVHNTSCKICVCKVFSINSIIIVQFNCNCDDPWSCNWETVWISSVAIICHYSADATCQHSFSTSICNSTDAVYLCARVRNIYYWNASTRNETDPSRVFCSDCNCDWSVDFKWSCSYSKLLFELTGSTYCALSSWDRTSKVTLILKFKALCITSLNFYILSYK